ncbi:MAG: hypothetical protein ACTSVC_08655, partial [Promethearchaeota archaeon]
MSEFLKKKYSQKSWIYKILERRVPKYNLPDPLKYSNGEILKEPDEWYSKRRDEILYLFKREVYGFAPETNAGIKIRG